MFIFPPSKMLSKDRNKGTNCQRAVLYELLRNTHTHTHTHPTLSATKYTHTNRCTISINQLKCTRSKYISLVLMSFKWYMCMNNFYLFYVLYHVIFVNIRFPVSLWPKGIVWTCPQWGLCECPSIYKYYKRCLRKSLHLCAFHSKLDLISHSSDVFSENAISSTGKVSRFLWRSSYIFAEYDNVRVCAKQHKWSVNTEISPSLQIHSNSLEKLSEIRCLPIKFLTGR